MDATTLPIYLCTLSEYNRASYDEEYDNGSLWAQLHERFVQTSSAGQATSLFLTTLQAEGAYMPSPGDWEVEITEWTTSYQNYSEEEKARNPLIKDQPAPEAEIRQEPGNITLDPRIRKAAQIVAQLWTDQMTKPLNKDNGDNNPLMFMLATANTQSAQHNNSASNLDAFRTLLILRIQADFARDPTRIFYRLSTDYHPDQTLSEVAGFAQIDPGAFPWKSTTLINLRDDKIEYRFGYTAQHTELPISP